MLIKRSDHGEQELTIVEYLIMEKLEFNMQIPAPSITRTTHPKSYFVKMSFYMVTENSVLKTMVSPLSELRVMISANARLTKQESCSFSESLTDVDHG
jgi:hypothetical protein